VNERILKINKLVKTHLGEIILKELSLKEGVFITISKVDTSPDLRYTRVSVSIFPEKETSYATAALEKEINKIQKMLNSKLRMKPLPKINFVLDYSEVRADEIEKLLKKI
jgi:ribosome-binding factor A